MAVDVKLPEVGDGIESGTVIAVLVKVGDRIEVDQTVLELETDKAVVEMPSPVAGTVTEVHVQANTEARIGSVVLTVDEAAAEDGAAPPAEVSKNGAEGSTDAVPPADAAPADAAPTDAVPPAAGRPEEDVGAGNAPRPVAPSPAQAPRDGSAVATPNAGSASAKKGNPTTAGVAPKAGADADDRPPLIPAAPSVRRLARERGIDLRAVHGSGLLGRISAADVRRPADGAPAPVAAPLPDFERWGEIERVPMTGIRKATVRSMTAAWTTVPMVTHFDEADATRFEALRQRFKGEVERVGAKLTPTAMLLQVVAAALRRFPDVNASVDPARQEIVYKRYVHVGVAVDTEHGLLVPVVKHADRKSVVELAVELGTLAEKARTRKLTPDDMSGGNFSVSNLGGIGGTGFTPIVNPPDVAILGVARSAMKPVWSEERGAFEPRLTMPLALTYDHRLIDGAAAARFLRWVCQAIEEPYLSTLGA